MSTFYIARQPILDTQCQTFGYELLFRSTQKNAYDPGVDGDTATARVLVNTIVEAGLDSIVGNSLAFINLTQRFLENPDMLDLLEPGRCVLEVLEDVVVNDAVVAGVEALRAKGHTIALDDFVDPEQFAELMPMASIIKYDITQHSMDALASYRLKDEQGGRLSLAERVETLEQFETLKSFGFHYFQGYYFAKPCMISGKKLPQNKVAILRLLAQVNDLSTTIDQLADTLSHDVALSVRTLRYVNSPLSALSNEVTSIQHAAVLLGREPIRNWVILLVMTGIDDKPPELTKMALTRARFCQLLSKERALGEDAMYFTIGLLSLLGVFMGTELEDALAQVSISTDVRSQLVNGSGAGADMLKLVIQLEKADADMESGDEAVGPIYQQSISWAEQTFCLL
ncbi:MAG: EAL and HDOD domain-containing protein [Granulosicoccus sp.]